MISLLFKTYKKKIILFCDFGIDFIIKFDESNNLIQTL